MEPKPRSLDKINRLFRKGVDIPNPVTLDIGEEVRVEQISPEGVKIYPGYRIYGGKDGCPDREGPEIGVNHEATGLVFNSIHSLTITNPASLASKKAVRSFPAIFERCLFPCLNHKQNQRDRHGARIPPAHLFRP